MGHRFEDGTNVHYQEGDRLWLSEAEANVLGNLGAPTLERLYLGMQ